MKYIFLILFFTSVVNSQSIYLLTGDNKICRLNADHSLTTVVTINFSGQILDIAIDSNGVFYGVTHENIIRVDLQSGNVTNLTTVVGYPTSLVCGQNFDLYYINETNKNLYSYNVITNVTSLVDYLGFGTSGDLAFYKGNLIFQSIDAETQSHYFIKAYNPITHSISDIYCLPSVLYQFWGLTSIFQSCEIESVFGINLYGQLFELDIAGQILTPVNISNPNINGYYGMASSTEFSGSSCSPVSVGDLHCIPLATNEFTKNEIFLYPIPARDAVYINSQNSIINISVYDLDGKLISKTHDLNSYIDIKNFKKGIYLLKIETNKRTYFKKIIKN